MTWQKVRKSVIIYVMTIINDTKTLQSYCQKLLQAEFFTIDTEFLRDKTYYPRLCLIQMAMPDDDPVAVDPLVSDLDLEPLFEVLRDKSVLKVFHAARQDLEIFYNEMGSVPEPIFDTQVAAMVSGYGDQVGYHGLVQQICKHNLDKGPQFTDWSRRPLSSKQLKYALEDVTHLRDVYLSLSSELKERGRDDWGQQEMRVLSNPATYENEDMLAWNRLKIRSDQPRVLAVLREVAAWREREAKARDIPRGRVLRDDTLVDISIHPPNNPSDLMRIRGVAKDMAESRHGKALIEAVKRGLDLPADQCPVRPKTKPFPKELQPVLEMLKMLLRIQASEHDVAGKLIASAKDLQHIAMSDDADVKALQGWRYEIFGKEAIALKHGKLTLGLKDNQIVKT